MTEAASDLARRLEQAAPDTWPAIDEWRYDGWVLRFGRGYTKRANSVTPTERGSRPLARKIDACEAAYAGRHIATVFRLPSTEATEELETTLAARQYRKLDKTSIRIKPLTSPLPASEALVEIAPKLTAEWFDPVAEWHGLDPRSRAGFEAIAGGIKDPTGFALVRSDGAPVAAGIAVRQKDLLCLHAIVAAPDARRKGFGRAVTVELLRWGQAGGARLAYLQVVKANAGALRLYNELGFDREVYRYHYRAQPIAPADSASSGTSAADPPDPT